MNQSALRYFLEVARTGSVNAAADRLRVAASAVSRQVAKLEDELGASLFERRSRGMVLTQAGRLLASYAQRTALESDQIVNEIRELSSAGRGLIRLGITEGLAVSFIPEMIHAFRLDRPHLLFNIKVFPPAGVVKAVQEGEVDVGVTFSVKPEGGVKIQWQQAMPSYAIASTNHPLIRRGRVEISELLKYPIAILDDAATIRQVLDMYCASKGVSLEPVATSTNIASLLTLCRLGAAVTFSAYISVRMAVRDGHVAIVPFNEARFLERNLQIQTMLGRTLTQTTMDFISFLVSELEKPEATYPISPEGGAA
ncbi:LysR family transcriptional regulator [Microvirga sp. KLBC 81]|uniref:LysR family transcriptional regulator n=1 Tax=Microvirga sp. KLBC 81 TaxID=1862707 RepID=UPI000D51B8AC|nr:LysR family transcriptional regulator [Microvirga sp. KLBC 81]PVE20885.1 LysR family transcriptional regulator [Microvirga sp. KLBC 81]